MKAMATPVGASTASLFILWGFASLAMASAGLSFAGFAPAGLLLGWRTTVGFYLLVWLVLNLWLLLPRRPASLRRFIARFVTVGMCVNVLSVLWLLLPFGDVALQLGTIIFTVIYVVTTQIATADQPRLGRVVILATTISMAAVTIIFRVPLWPYLAPFLLVFGLAMIALSNQVANAIADMRAARRRAEADRDARTRFLAAASHDLGQPLQSARLFLDQALRSTDAGKRDRAGRHARDALGAMERLLNQMLDHLRLEAGAVQPRVRPVTAGETIAQVAAQFGPAAALSATELIAVPSRLTVLADPDMVARALGNLVDNALRHAGAQRVLVGAKSAGSRARLYVIDDGRGLVEGERERLFDEYVQGADAGAGERGGFGLGLASVRRMAELMGGRAAIDPGWCKGAAFFIELPMGGHQGQAA